MRLKYLYIGLGAGVAFAAFMAYRKAQPPPPSNVSALYTSPQPASYLIDAGLGGVYPLTTFPDINGTSANVPMPT